MGYKCAKANTGTQIKQTLSQINTVNTKEKSV